MRTLLAYIGLYRERNKMKYREKRQRPCCKPNASERRDDGLAGNIAGVRAAAASRC